MMDATEQDREDAFVLRVARVESDRNPRAWGDNDYAVGQWQDHASYYASWGPKIADFGGEERSWNWCFEFAIRRFFRAARQMYPGMTDLQIAMARHLHGQIKLGGWDAAYVTKWNKFA